MLAASLACTAPARAADSGASDEPATPAPVVASLAVASPPIPPETPPVPKPTPEYLGVEAGLGGSARLGEPSDGGRPSSAGGLAYHAGIHYGWSRRSSLGLSFDSASLGTSDRQGSSVQLASDTRRLNVLALEARVHAVRWDHGRLFLGLLAGLGWETAHQIAAVDGATGTASAVRATRCSGRSDPSMALGVTGGVDLELGRDVALVGRGQLVAARLPDEPVEASENCIIPSGGSANMFSATLGLQLRFDFSGSWNSR